MAASYTVDEATLDKWMEDHCILPNTIRELFPEYGKRIYKCGDIFKCGSEYYVLVQTGSYSFSLIGTHSFNRLNDNLNDFIAKSSCKSKVIIAEEFFQGRLHDLIHIPCAVLEVEE